LESAKNLSAGKALTILEYIAFGENEPKRLQDIAASLSMNNSTAFRFVQSLVQSGYVQQDPDTSQYFLTAKICALSARVISNLHIQDLAQPIMKRLAAEFTESVCLAVERDMCVVYISVRQGPHQMLRAMQYIGNQAPLHCTGVGKLLLLNYSDSDLNEFIRVKGLPKFTENTLTTKTALLAELADIRNKGYAFDNEECERGARCVAVPIRDYTRKIIAALSVTGAVFRMTEDKLMNKLDILLDAGRQLSQSLGYDE
jgi:DNA-binding IclR family transcriptional regulator